MYYIEDKSGFSQDQFWNILDLSDFDVISLQVNHYLNNIDKQKIR